MGEIILGPEERQAIYDATRSAMMNDPQMRQAVYTATLDAARENNERVTELEADNTALREALDEAREALERDRAKLATHVDAINRAISPYQWLREGRGSYEYDDDRWMDEFSDMWTALKSALEPLDRTARDWSNCPTAEDEIRRARKALGR